MWFVAVRAITDKADEALGVKHIGHSPRGRTPEPHPKKIMQSEKKEEPHASSCVCKSE